MQILLQSLVLRKIPVGSITTVNFMPVNFAKAVHPGQCGQPLILALFLLRGYQLEEAQSLM